ncbi:hypothetical protein EYC08_21085 [Tabrizicola sp. WMC-M-20]|nr:hypothetical protein EYC08_21085 [Tabrizicola sp. WMC-M-20]
MLRELEHRVRNAFATILALTRQLLRSSDILEAFREEFPAQLKDEPRHPVIHRGGTKVLFAQGKPRYGRDRRSGADS